MWKNVKIVHGKPRHNQTQGSVERANQDMQNILTAWMNDNDTNKWSEDLPFVQFAKITTYPEGIRQCPYEAMFGIKAKRGMASSFLPSEQIANISKPKNNLKKLPILLKPKNSLKKLVILLKNI
ncbi:KRAB-A domain-containing protein 2 [Trichonephila clavata]|uniref:KRAB-A domain-containing protein 2 n=1 Tax=Trichonephila clavata TaxID=2740835 RepID=A0A8X6KYW7_TRICU|nr:KRAB-A domain-containing protein 2 [Trichonephila clavata]